MCYVTNGPHQIGDLPILVGTKHPYYIGIKKILNSNLF